jgi:hypothetical protein
MDEIQTVRQALYSALGTVTVPWLKQVPHKHAIENHAFLVTQNTLKILGYRNTQKMAASVSGCPRERLELLLGDDCLDYGSSVLKTACG